MSWTPVGLNLLGSSVQTPTQQISRQEIVKHLLNPSTSVTEVLQALQAQEKSDFPKVLCEVLSDLRSYQDPTYIENILKEVFTYLDYRSTYEAFSLLLEKHPLDFIYLFAKPKYKEELGKIFDFIACFEENLIEHLYNAVTLLFEEDLSDESKRSYFSFLLLAANSQEGRQFLVVYSKSFPNAIKILASLVDIFPEVNEKEKYLSLCFWGLNGNFDQIITFLIHLNLEDSRNVDYFFSLLQNHMLTSLECWIILFENVVNGQKDKLQKARLEVLNKIIEALCNETLPKMKVVGEDSESSEDESSPSLFDEFVNRLLELDHASQIYFIYCLPSEIQSTVLKQYFSRDNLPTVALWMNGLVFLENDFEAQQNTFDYFFAFVESKDLIPLLHCLNEEKFSKLLLHLFLNLTNDELQLLCVHSESLGEDEIEKIQLRTELFHKIPIRPYTGKLLEHIKKNDMYDWIMTQMLIFNSHLTVENPSEYKYSCLENIFIYMAESFPVEGDLQPDNQGLLNEIPPFLMGLAYYHAVYKPFVLKYFKFLSDEQKKAVVKALPYEEVFEEIEKVLPELERGQVGGILNALSLIQIEKYVDKKMSQTLALKEEVERKLLRLKESLNQKSKEHMKSRTSFNQTQMLYQTLVAHVRQVLVNPLYPALVKEMERPSSDYIKQKWYLPLIELLQYFKQTGLELNGQSLGKPLSNSLVENSFGQQLRKWENSLGIEQDEEKIDASFWELLTLKNLEYLKIKDEDQLAAIGISTNKDLKRLGIEKGRQQVLDELASRIKSLTNHKDIFKTRWNSYFLWQFKDLEEGCYSEEIIDLLDISAKSVTKIAHFGTTFADLILSISTSRMEKKDRILNLKQNLESEQNQKGENKQAIWDYIGLLIKEGMQLLKEEKITPDSDLNQTVYLSLEALAISEQEFHENWMILLNLSIDMGSEDFKACRSKLMEFLHLSRKTPQSIRKVIQDLYETIGKIPQLDQGSQEKIKNQLKQLDSSQTNLVKMAEKAVLSSINMIKKWHPMSCLKRYVKQAENLPDIWQFFHAQGWKSLSQVNGESFGLKLKYKDFFELEKLRAQIDDHKKKQIKRRRLNVLE